MVGRKVLVDAPSHGQVTGASASCPGEDIARSTNLIDSYPSTYAEGNMEHQAALLCKDTFSCR